MKKIILLSLGIVVTSIYSCKKEDTGVIPAPVENLIATALPGEIEISWTQKEPVYEYLKITYFDKLEQKEMVRLASKYSTSIVIPNTRAKYGEYTFTVQPFNALKQGGEIQTVKGVSGVAPATYQFTEADDAVQLALTASMLSTNAQESSEGPITNSIDSNLSTYFHTAWSVSIGAQHYFQVSLPEPIQGFKFGFSTRHNGNGGGDIKRMKIEASNDGTNWVEVATQTYDLSTDVAADRTKVFGNVPVLMQQQYSMLRFTPLARRSADPLNQSWFNLSEIYLYKEPIIVIDPES